MTRLITLLIVGSLFFCSSTQAQESGFGLGVVIGAPTGIGVKVWMGKEKAICGIAGWSLEEWKYVHLQGDYVFHNFNIFKLEEGKLPVYYGIGGRIVIQDKVRLGIRIPAGMDYLLPKAPLDIFLELAPLLYIMPETKFYLNGSIGIRFFFG